MRRTRTSRPPRGARAVRICHDHLRDRHRPRGPRAALDALEDVLRVPDDLRRAAQHADVSGVSGDAGCAPGRESPGGRVRDPHGPGVRLSRQRRVPLRAQALLLPGHAEELSDQPVRGAAGRERLPRDRYRGRRARHRDPAAAPRGGRGQAPPRGHARDRAGEPCRLQPFRRGAHGDRLAARALVARRGRGLPESVPRRGDLPRRLRRQYGGRLAPVRREHLHPASGKRSARNEGRDQEPELVPQRPASARVRGAAPGAGARCGRAHRPGDAPLGRRPRLHALDALEGVRARLSLLPRARPGPAPDRPAVGRGDPGGASRAAARLAATGGRAVRAAALRRRGFDAVARARGLLRSRAAGVGARAGGS